MVWDLEAQIDSDNSARSGKPHPAMEGDGIGLSRGARQT